MRKLGLALGLSMTALVVACGGGGGSAGTVSAEYQITLSADKTQLPINTGHMGPGKGVEYPYTTVLHVNATVAGQPIPGGEEIFGCNLSGGLNSGALYYLDGNEDHEIEIDDGQGGKIRVPGAYRSITLGSNAGGNSFHFHAGDAAGIARITCSVTDPRDKQVKYASVDISIGGGSGTGKAASIQSTAQYSNLGAQGNLYNLRTSTAINAYIWDDRNQPVSANGKTDLQISLRSVDAIASGARLLAGDQQGNVVQVKSTGGVGIFSLSSGTATGPILLEITTDRADSDVTNGIQDPITGLLVVGVSSGASAGPAVATLELVDVAPPNAINGVPYSYVLSAKGGVPPYTWTVLGGLPDGMSFSSSGLLSGTPNMKVPGAVSVAVRVTDSVGSSTTGNFVLTVKNTPAGDPATSPLSIDLAGCGTDPNTVCDLPGAPVGGLYQYVLSATGGGAGDVAWATEGVLPTGLTLSGTGILSWNTVPVACGPIGNPFFIRATRGTATTLRQVRVRGVTGPGGTC